MVLDQFIRKPQSKTKSDYSEDLTSDRPIRSIVKSISWRALGTMDTIIISWVITGKVTMALTIGSIELVTKMVLYFLHERLWNIIKWGKK
jgi:uncharacterized membrane protein